MAEDLKIRKARSVYRKLAEAVEKNGWKYKSDDFKLAVAYAIKVSSGAEYTFIVSVDPERQLVCLKSLPVLEFDVSRRREAALAVCAVNFLIADGNFDIRSEDGALTYRQALAFHGSTNLSVEAITYLLDYALYAVDALAEKFGLVNESKLAGAEFMEACKEVLS